MLLSIVICVEERMLGLIFIVGCVYTYSHIVDISVFNQGSLLDTNNRFAL